MPNCPSCDAEIGPGASSCPQCGFPHRAGDAPADDLSKTRTLKPEEPTVLADGPTVSAPISSPVSSASSVDGGRFVAGTLLAGRYRIVGLLGRGGMGEVYRADDLRLGEKVALKFLPEDLARDGAALARFHREVKVARQITHRNVCRVYDLGEADGHAFLSMEYVDGEDLNTLIQRIGHLPQAKAHEVARQLCAGLAAAHERGVLHRDLKPANVMIDGRGEAKMMDFGLAGVVEDLPEGELAGTPAYMAPEQLVEGKVSFRSDVYSLGLILYELYTGQRPYPARSRAEMLTLQRQGPPRPSAQVSDLDPLVDETLLRCLEHDPARRPRTALEVSAALPGGDPLAAALRAGETPSPEMVAAASTPGTLARRTAWALASSALLLVAAWIYFAERTQLVALADLDQPPEVLRFRAEELIERLLPEEPERRFDAEGWKTQAAYLEHLYESSDPMRWQRIRDDRFSPFSYFYRESQDPLTPTGGSIVTEADTPPLRWPGGVRVELDPSGRLLGWWSIPQGPSSIARTTTDWRPLFAAAGLDLDDFRPTEPAWTVPMPSDQRLAWEGIDPDAGVALRIEAASVDGTPTYFVVLPPWDRDGGDRLGTTLTRSERDIAAIWSIPMLVLILTVGVWLAHRHLANGRADRHGATRIAILFSGTFLALWALGGEHSTTAKELSYLQLGLAFALYGGAYYCVSYLALEPYLRRFLPHTLITWTRLLRGDVRDPRVARDILAGALCAGLVLVAIGVHNDLLPRLGIPVPIYDDIWELHLGGTRGLLAALVSSHIQVPLSGMLTLSFVYLLLRVLLKREWPSRIAFFLVVTIALPLALPLAAFMALLATGLLTRFGMVAFGAMMVFFLLLHQTPMTTDPTSWYAENTVVAVSIYAAVVVLSARWASGAGQAQARPAAS